jgi:hypothetical protein
MYRLWVARVERALVRKRIGSPASLCQANGLTVGSLTRLMAPFAIDNEWRLRNDRDLIECSTFELEQKYESESPRRREGTTRVPQKFSEGGERHE